MPKTIIFTSKQSEKLPVTGWNTQQPRLLMYVIKKFIDRKLQGVVSRFSHIYLVVLNPIISNIYGGFFA